jgi:transposase
MVRRRISDDVKQMALAMSLQRIPQSEIRQLTGVSERSLKRLRSSYRKTDAVSAKSATTGRPRLLTSVEVKVRHIYLWKMKLPHAVSPLQYLCDCVERQPDTSLLELQAMLREGCAVEASLQTITRSLQREGYTMKTVSFFSSS